MEITRIGAILFLVLTPTYNFRIALVIPAIYRRGIKSLNKFDML